MGAFGYTPWTRRVVLLRPWIWDGYGSPFWAVRMVSRLVDELKKTEIIQDKAFNEIKSSATLSLGRIKGPTPIVKYL